MTSLFSRLAVSLSALLGFASVGAVASAQTADLPDFEAAVADTENWRAVDPANLVTFEVADAGQRSKGIVYIELAPWAAPKHVERIRTLAKNGQYDGTVFHRVIDDFMAQGGDIEKIIATGSGLPDLEAEFSFQRNPMELALNGPAAPELATIGFIDGFPVRSKSPLIMQLTGETTVESWISHCKGTTSMARTSAEDSANSQFFLMRATKQHLDNDSGRYSAWGRVVAGQDVVDGIRRGSDQQNGAVQTPDVLVTAKFVAELPEAEQPRLLVERTDSPAFLAKLEAAGVAAAQDGTPVSKMNVCDLPKPRTLLKTPF